MDGERSPLEKAPRLVRRDERRGRGASSEVEKRAGVLMEIFTGEDKYELITIPPGVANGYKTIGTIPALVANCATLPHDPDEIQRIDPFTKSIPYDWSLKHG